MNSSIYIPRMKTCRTVEEVTAAFQNNDFGIVSRVDFTPINKRPGFGENVDTVVKSAFVHFSKLFQEGQCAIYYASRGEACKFHPFEDNSEYWLILIAQNPIPDTMMNTAQIVENCRLLEKKVEEQDAQIKNLERKLDNVQQVVLQLVGNLFNQRTQGKTIDDYISILFPGEPIYKNSFETVEEESKWENWATTRQGDANEERIAKLESIVFCQENEVHDTALFERKRATSLSSDSGVHDLISCVSSCSSTSYEERIRISEELCGNQ